MIVAFAGSVTTTYDWETTGSVAGSFQRRRPPLGFSHGSLRGATDPARTRCGEAPDHIDQGISVSGTEGPSLQVSEVRFGDWTPTVDGRH